MIFEFIVDTKNCCEHNIVARQRHKGPGSWKKEKMKKKNLIKGEELEMFAYKNAEKLLKLKIEKK